MAARGALQSLLEEDVELGAETVYPTNAVDTAPEDFFAVINWGPVVKAYNQTGTNRVSIWLHDRSRDYSRINDGLRRLKELLPSVLERQGEDGYVLVVAEWEGESQDLFDGGYETITRYAEFTVLSRYASP